MPPEDKAFSKEFQRSRLSLADQLADLHGAVRWRSEPGSELAQLREEVHRRFDPLWEFGVMSRREMYVRLAWAMALPQVRCHVGMFDAHDCQRALALRDVIAEGCEPVVR